MRKGVICRREGEGLLERTLDGRKLRLLFRSQVLEAILIELESGTGFEGTYHHEGEEMYVVLEGEIEYTIAGERYVVGRGGSLWHEASLPHSIRNISPQKAVYIAVMSPPSFH